jgi:hypothetical protein
VLCIYTKLMPELQWGQEVVMRDAVLAWSHRSVWSNRLVYSAVNSCNERESASLEYMYVSI